MLPSHLPTAVQIHLAQNMSAMHSKCSRFGASKKPKVCIYPYPLWKTCCWSYSANQGLIKTLRVSFFVCSILSFLWCFLTAVAIFRQPQRETSSCNLVTPEHSSFNAGKHPLTNAQQSKSYRWLQHFIEVGWWGCIYAHRMRVMPEKGCTDYWCIADKM